MIIQVSQPDFLKQIPHDSGVYCYYDKDNVLLYVGKAIDLQKRIQSYFRKSAILSPRIYLMVQKIVYLELRVTQNEDAALILENNLIKSLKPKYNIVFRDDKSYPSIKISKHEFPNIEYFRGKIITGNVYGPYPNSYEVKNMLELAQKIFKIRTCSDSEFNSRKRPCMLYQINRCSAPCVNEISKEDYMVQIKLLSNLLRGNYSTVTTKLMEQMQQAADNLDFETAAILRDKITTIRSLQSQQLVNNDNSLVNADIFLIHELETKIIYHIISVRSGIYLGDKNIIVNKQITSIETHDLFLDDYYAKQNNLSGLAVYFCNEISPEVRVFLEDKYEIIIKHKINLVSLKKLYQKGIINIAKVALNTGDVFLESKKRLLEITGLEKIERIECYDISHDHGSHALGVMVVYEDGIVDHSKYRKFNLDDKVNGDDILAMQIVLKRRLASQDLKLPQVLLIDGGINQVNAIKNILHDMQLYDKIKVLGMFKGEKRDPTLDCLYIDSQTSKISYQQDPVVFKLLHELRDEAHRFAISGHRKKKIKSMSNSILSEIPNIGIKKQKLLINYFGSAKAVALASVEELSNTPMIGANLAKEIYNFFH